MLPLSFHCPGHLADEDAPEIELVARIVDVDSHDPPIRVVVHHDALRNLPAVNAWPLRKLE
jgi:hypothetical protein